MPPQSSEFVGNGFTPQDTVRLCRLPQRVTAVKGWALPCYNCLPKEVFLNYFSTIAGNLYNTFLSFHQVPRQIRWRHACSRRDIVSEAWHRTQTCRMLLAASSHHSILYYEFSHTYDVCFFLFSWLGVRVTVPTVRGFLGRYWQQEKSLLCTPGTSLRRRYCYQLIWKQIL